MVYRHYEDLIDDFSIQAIQYKWVSGKKISPNASAAVIASEDQQFYQHFGFDLQSIRSSISAYINGVTTTKRSQHNNPTSRQKFIF